MDISGKKDEVCRREGRERREEGDKDRRRDKRRKGEDMQGEDGRKEQKEELCCDTMRTQA